MTAPAHQPEDGSLAEPDDLARMLPLVYDELRSIAGGMLGGRARVTLQPTMLVHEAFMKVASERKGEWKDEGHFRAVASIAMRRVLADHVRGRSRLKRGGEQQRVSLDLNALGTGEQHGAEDLDAALDELEASSPRVARLVIFRFFGDLSVQQSAERLGISVSTAEADWRFAKAWLKRRLKGNGDAA